MRDEGARVYRVTRLGAQPHLQRCERTDYAEPGLENDNRYRYQVAQPEPAIADPLPAEQFSAEYQQQADNDEYDKGYVQIKNEIGNDEV